MKKVLGIFAHCDDEILFGWPIFQSDEFEKHLIICCDDSTRNRLGRKRALKQVCKQENINLYKILSEDNNFYAMPTRRANYVLTDAVSHIEFWLEKAITDINPDFIFSHNFQGEYGHGSHRLLFQLVSQDPKVKNLFITDICSKSNHRSSISIPKFIWDLFYKGNLWKENIVLDYDFYQRCKNIYDRYNAWTWSKEPIKQCSLFLLKEEGCNDA